MLQKRMVRYEATCHIHPFCSFCNVSQHFEIMTIAPIHKAQNIRVLFELTPCHMRDDGRARLLDLGMEDAGRCGLWSLDL